MGPEVVVPRRLLGDIRSNKDSRRRSKSWIEYVHYVPGIRIVPTDTHLSCFLVQTASNSVTDLAHF